MRRNENNVCEICKVICPYGLHCIECDVHSSVERAIKISTEKYGEQNKEINE